MNKHCFFGRRTRIPLPTEESRVEEEIALCSLHSPKLVYAGSWVRSTNEKDCCGYLQL